MEVGEGNRWHTLRWSSASATSPSLVECERHLPPRWSSASASERIETIARSLRKYELPSGCADDDRPAVSQGGRRVSGRVSGGLRRRPAVFCACRWRSCNVGGETVDSRQIAGFGRRSHLPTPPPQHPKVGNFGRHAVACGLHPAWRASLPTLGAGRHHSSNNSSPQQRKRTPDQMAGGPSVS